MEEEKKYCCTAMAYAIHKCLLTDKNGEILITLSEDVGKTMVLNYCPFCSTELTERK